MTTAEFDRLMSEIDRELIVCGVPASQRFILAYFRLTGERTLEVQKRDRRVGPYEGANLYWSVVDWYTAQYPAQVTIGYDWGPRLLVLRGEVFRAEIPVHLNPGRPLDALRFLPELSIPLRESLTADERRAIQTTYNQFFNQASDLALNWTRWCAPRQHGLVSDLIDRAWQDLRGACQAFSIHDPASVLFAAQQAPEKYLKAMIVVHDRALTEDTLRKKYGHKVPKLAEVCKQIDPAFARFDVDLRRLDYGPDVRYHRQAMRGRDVVQVIDLAHDICHTAAMHLLDVALG